MRMSIEWLRDYVDFDMPVDLLEEKLVLSGTAVEAVHHMGTGALGVYTGRILAIEPHPDADKLVVCTVTLGERTAQIAGSETLSIVCGATNMKSGDSVPVAILGAKLPGDFLIEGRKIRGVPSQGMLCSETELKLAEESAGLMILPEDTPLGIPIDEALGLADTVLELEITPNRPDCMSMIGMAREVGAIVGATLKRPTVSVPAVGGESAGDVASDGPVADIELRDPARCPRYMGRIISGVKIGPSPEWMQKRLAAAGMRPINNVVDITNYVMLETGQPLHAFDRKLLAGSKIIVRRAEEGEGIVTLDGQDRKLSSDDLVIADADKPVALAGVMGSASAEVNADTVDVLLEAAYFKPEEVMSTARGIGLITESSARFERGVDPNGVAYACDRAASLMAELAGGVVSQACVDLYPVPVLPLELHMRTGRCRDILGIELGDDAMSAHLASLELVPRLVRDRIAACKPATGGLDASCRPEPTIDVTVPTFRRDLEREIDLIEEVARIYGYDKVESTLPRHSSATAGLTRYQSRERTARESLMGAGLFEMMTNTLQSTADIAAVMGETSDPMDRHGRSFVANAVTLSNPLGEEYSRLRSTLMPGMLTSLKRNITGGSSGIAAFEIGRTFLAPQEQTPDESTPGDPTQEAPTLETPPSPAEVAQSTSAASARFPTERRSLGIVLWGEAAFRELNSQTRGGLRHQDFFELKGILELLFERLIGNVPRMRRPSDGSLLPWLHPGVSALIKGYGWAGMLHPRTADELDLPGEVFVAELDLGAILSAKLAAPAYQPLPRFPGVTEDLSVLAPVSSSASEIEQIIRQSAGKYLADLSLFDLYTGEGLPEGKKSLAYALTFRSAEQTLTDDEVSRSRQKIIAALAKGGFEVRGAPGE